MSLLRFNAYVNQIVVMTKLKSPFSTEGEQQNLRKFQCPNVAFCSTQFIVCMVRCFISKYWFLYSKNVISLMNNWLVSKA